jgi:hypothetical protein
LWRVLGPAFGCVLTAHPANPCTPPRPRPRPPARPPAQASHLLRALRQNREAAALGLLEAGGPGAGAPGDARGVEAAVAQRQQGAALGKRIASLTRFLLDHLSK